ncbi:hypothetical protein B0H11DRAFT_429518 [Mycena galericulata]|nr:hypothetical protein B0H11DRAFT_429518 [Mycena galericulata]
MANNLPDEIVSEILSPALKVSDDAFSDTSRNSPFAVYSESSSAFLLVSKAWLRVATPLLYHVVVLRSKAQAAALDSALRDNKELGRFIKKLRVEGGYGGSMFKIIKAAPNITDIFISLNIWSDDNVGGLIRGLPLINPTRVVLHDTEGTRNKNIHLLHDAVTQCIKGWKNLTVFEIPYSNNNYYHSREASEAIGSALKEAPNLKTVIIPAIPVTRTIPHYLVLIAQNPSVRSIQFKETSNFKIPDYFYRGYNAPALADPSLRGLIKAPVDIPNDDSMNFPSASPSPQPTPRPLQFSTASVTEDIWERIISFAAVLTFNNDRTRSKPRLGIVLVSKMFARLALPYFYEAIILRTPWQFDDLMVHLNADPILCSRVRTLYLSTNAHINLRPALPRIRLLNLIGQAPFGMTCKAFSDLGKHSGPTLVRLEGIQVAKGSTVQNPSVFSSFHHLRSLSIGFKGSFDMKSSSIPVGALANLEELSLSAMDGSLLTVLTEMECVSTTSLYSC